LRAVHLYSIFRNPGSMVLNQFILHKGVKASEPFL
jgi:hypothetical protein